MMGSSKVLWIVYIRTIHWTKHNYSFFEEYNVLTKTIIMKQVIDEKKLFKSGIITRKEVNDEVTALWR